MSFYARISYSVEPYKEVNELYVSNLSSFGFEGGNFKETEHLQESEARLAKIIISHIDPQLTFAFIFK